MAALHMTVSHQTSDSDNRNPACQENPPENRLTRATAGVRIRHLATDHRVEGLPAGRVEGGHRQIPDSTA